MDFTNFDVHFKFIAIFALFYGFSSECACDQENQESSNSDQGNNTPKGGSAPPSPPEMISSDPNDVKFFLYPDSKNPEYKQRIFPGDLDSVRTSNYNSTLPLKVLIHGFMSNSTDILGFVDRIKNAYLEVKTQANIICVDWGRLSTVKDRLPLLPFYAAAVKNVQLVGKLVAEFLMFLISNGFVESPARIHLVGFSLGAQVSGVAGYLVLQNSSSPIQRITGLDPAGPSFKNLKGRDFKLDSTDASFVDVTHTNQGENGYGGTLGHVDFYPNGGGPKQPSCLNVSEPVKTMAGICAHSFAYKLFEESIRSNNDIIACKCDSSMILDAPCSSLNASTCHPSTIFGERCPQSARGKFYFKIKL